MACTNFGVTRNELITKICEHKYVLDIGCVDHDFDKRSQGWWLHDVIRDVARQVVGVDVDLAGIEKMKAAGYDAIHEDITVDANETAERAPFEVIVAGEIIEHLPCPQHLLESTRDLLRPDGQLVVTTPNPYAPWRMRTGQLGKTWENVDHIAYMFPSGMAEMADRTGFRLATYGSVDWYGQPRTITGTAKAYFRAWRKRHREQPWLRDRFGVATHPHWASPLDALLMKVRRGPMLFEDAVYVLEPT
jgi:SAM-dependent methyltransferase